MTKTVKYTAICKGWKLINLYLLSSPPRRGIENFRESGFSSVRILCHSSESPTCCSHIQQSLNCICPFYGKEHEASYGVRRLSGKAGNDCT